MKLNYTYLPRFLIILFIAELFIPKSNCLAQFPSERPAKGSYQRPRSGEVLDISPPGFCWWRAGKIGEVTYQLVVMNQSGETMYRSGLLEDPVHVPDVIMEPGDYNWTVLAYDKNGRVIDQRTPDKFSIRSGFVSQPWIKPEDLLNRVRKEHPRLLFPYAQLDEIRSTLGTSRREAYEGLKKDADRALRLSVPPEPDYDEIDDPAVRKLAYNKSFAELRGYHQNGMDPLALMYLLSGDRKYGLKAKEILLGATEWDPEGISSVLAPYGDEVGLSLVRSEAHTYDWIYDLLTDQERDKVKAMLIARADQMLRRLIKRDYLENPSESHNGRLPGYLIEHALVLAEEPRAQVWMDYAMRTVMTCFPHWAGKDGGWAEGISYGLAYNAIYLVPYESLRIATGLDLWQRPFYKDVRKFFMYAISPVGDIKPFGDTEHASATGSASSIRSLLHFHANRFNDPVVKWWISLLKASDGDDPELGGTPALILPDTVEAARPETIENDAAFFGIGWAVLHSNILDPENDLMVSFKSSPYGGVSHSHADQNSFAIMKGGKSLAIPGGARYPTHGSPFHVEYVQQTMAHNAVLIDGKGQINRDGSRGGMLVDFRSTPHMGYVAGDATNCFDKPVQKNVRHMLMVRPYFIVVVDDIETDQPVNIDWLLHAHNPFKINESGQSLISEKEDEWMNVLLYTGNGFDFSQTDNWPVDPKKGYPKTSLEPPQNQWHFTATTRTPATSSRILAIMVVRDKGKAPDFSIEKTSKGFIKLIGKHGGDAYSVEVNLNSQVTGPIIKSQYVPLNQAAESIVIDPGCAL